MIQPLDDTLLVDRFALRDMAERIIEAERTRRPFDRLLRQFQTRLRASQERVALRRRNRPALSYDPELPITALHQELADAIQKHPVVVVCGETGSGKSTQLPKICLDIGRGIHGLIGHTQPRRIAARSIAGRLAEELSSAVGRHVGFKIRFSDTTSPDSYIKLMTDGILLAETQGDPWLHQYDTIIVDEAHERSLNIDFLLGYLQRLLPQRPELRVIITSATIDVERFSQHFATAAGPAPIIMVSGRTYPVRSSSSSSSAR
ncbi:MAG: DEAD/DEAH box helicase, partial [Planctomycetota bacterium]